MILMSNVLFGRRSGIFFLKSVFLITYQYFSCFGTYLSTAAFFPREFFMLFISKNLCTLAIRVPLFGEY